MIKQGFDIKSELTKIASLILAADKKRPKGLRPEKSSSVLKIKREKVPPLLKDLLQKPKPPVITRSDFVDLLDRLKVLKSEVTQFSNAGILTEKGPKVRLLDIISKDLSVIQTIVNKFGKDLTSPVSPLDRVSYEKIMVDTKLTEKQVTRETGSGVDSFLDRVVKVSPHGLKRLKGNWPDLGKGKK